MTAIELLILDVDGVMTDGGLEVSATGEVSKTFYVRDGQAIKTWRQQGRKVAILSGRSDPSVVARAAELGIECVKSGVSDKLAGYEEIKKEFGLRDQDIAYMGDDIPDVVVLQRCGFSVAVANAAPPVKRQAQYVTRAGGGRGAVAEVIDLLLRTQREG